MKNIIKIFGIALFSLAGILVCGVTLAATVFDLQPAATITYNEDLTVNGTGRFNSVYIGKQGVGGVTFFNGTIVNQTTTNGADNPVTFGDNVRIDGEIWRTEKGGNNPIKVSDHVIPTMDNVNNFGSKDHRWKNGYFSGALAIGSLVGNVVTSANIVDGTITEADLANNAVTTGKIKDGTITEADLANNAVTTGKIKDGTIRGSDVNTSTDITAANFLYNSAKTRHWSITGAEFIPSDETYAYTESVGTLHSTDGYFTAPVHLPNGATVTKVTMHYYDNVALRSIRLYLSRNTMKMQQDDMAYINPTTDQSGWRTAEDNTISYATIDNSQYAYRLWVSFGAANPDMRLGGVEIEYTVPNPLP